MRCASSSAGTLTPARTTTAPRREPVRPRGLKPGSARGEQRGRIVRSCDSRRPTPRRGRLWGPRSRRPRPPRSRASCRVGRACHRTSRMAGSDRRHQLRRRKVQGIQSSAEHPSSTMLRGRAGRHFVKATMKVRCQSRSSAATGVHVPRVIIQTTVEQQAAPRPARSSSRSPSLETGRQLDRARRMHCQPGVRHSRFDQRRRSGDRARAAVLRGRSRSCWTLCPPRGRSPWMTGSGGRSCPPPDGPASSATPRTRLSPPADGDEGAPGALATGHRLQDLAVPGAFDVLGRLCACSSRIGRRSIVVSHLASDVDVCATRGRP